MTHRGDLSIDDTITWLAGALGLSGGDRPFPWQIELLRRFEKGEIPPALDIPTGLGKTAVMAIWLVARARSAQLPRRLVYVVDRRAVVDQATEMAMRLRNFVSSTPQLKERLGLKDELPISTLRGQYVDNREWLEDPASPAIIVGTIDMIGSRLLFEGYGTSRKMRSYHAGLLGADTLVVLDEAHLVPPFEELLQTIANDRTGFGPREDALRQLVPPFRLMSLSATGRRTSDRVFSLQPADLEHYEVRRRLHATKRLVVQPLDDHMKLADALAQHAWALSGQGRQPVRCIVFCDKRMDAAEAKQALEELAKKEKLTVDTELFVGGRRVLERQDAARRLKELGFIAGAEIDRMRPAFVFATSAGEVGVDLDADHMISDLVAWERMVQRLGRVNRRGNGQADVIVVVEPEPKPDKKVQAALKKRPEDRDEKERKAIAKYKESLARARARKDALDRLPKKDGFGDASPGALRELRHKAEEDPALREILDAATTPAPLRPALTRALVDAWSMTSLDEHTGRPDIGPWLRGWIDDDPPRTAVVWRTHLPVRRWGADRVEVVRREVEAFFEAAPPHASEVLETETFHVVDWLVKRAMTVGKAGSKRSPAPSREGETTGMLPLRRSDVAAVVLTAAGDLSKTLRLEDLLGEDAKKKLKQSVAGATLVVDARLAGLKNGLLDADEGIPPRTVDDGKPWMEDEASGSQGQAPVVGFRILTVQAGQALPPDEQWHERLRFATEVSEDGEPIRWLVVEKWRYDATTEEDRSTGRSQLLDQHQSWTELKARDLASRLGFQSEYAEMLAIAARLHDEGKRVRRWQRAFNAPDDGRTYAKTQGPINYRLLDGYRHELGSLACAEKDELLKRLPDGLRDLALHLIASHHGFARPVISTRSCEDAPPSVLEVRAEETALRFARLQKRWGPWGLAWWEALLRAADQQASRDNDTADFAVAKESV